MVGLVYGEDKVREASPVGATSDYRSGIAPKVQNYKQGSVSMTGTATHYYYFVEHGRKKGKFPPWGKGSALRLWVKRVIGVSGKALSVTSFLIARSIAKGSKNNPKGGTRAQYIFRNTENNERRNIARIIEKAMRKLERAYSD